MAVSPLVEPTRAAHRLQPRDSERVQRVGDRLEMTRGQVQVDDGVPDLGMAEQQLDRSDVSPGLQQVRRIRVSTMSLPR